MGASDPCTIGLTLSNLLLVGLCLGIGRFFRARLEGQSLDNFVLSISLPAVAFLTMRKVSDVSMVGPLSVWLGVGLSILIGMILLRRFDKATVACLILCMGFSNTSFVGFPLLEAVVGPQAIPVALLIDQLGSFVCVCTVGMAVVAWGSGTALSGRSIALRLFRFPPVIASILGLLSKMIVVPEVFLQAMERLGSTLTPLALVSIGTGLVWPQRHLWKAILPVLTWKLLLMPALALAWAMLWGAQGLEREVICLEAGMAPMVTAVVLARQAGLRPELAGAMLSVGVPCSLLTIPAWHWILSA